MSTWSVLLVDDSPAILQYLDRLFARAGWAVFTATSGSAALGVLQDQDVDALVTDVRMPDVNGIELISLVRARKPEISAVALTGYHDYETVRDARLAGALKVFCKPMHSPTRLLHFLTDLLSAKRRRKRSGDRLDHAGQSLVGLTPCMVQVYERIVEYAQTDYPVLVIGENGTGKELVASEIHRLSSRSMHRVVVGNCAAIPRELQESHMFGHNKGSFTGATSDHRGWFEHTGEGTVVLDEIGDAAADLQAKLLRVLESREFYRVGSHDPIPLRARIISSTNQDLQKLVTAGDFREDLFHRLAVLVLYVPPLRERMEDVELLASHFLGIEARSLGQQVPRLTSDAKEALIEHDWPGNVRELRNCIMRGLVHANDSGEIRASHLEVAGADGQPAVLRSLRDVQREHVALVLRVTGGNKSRAADILGISRQAVYRYLKKTARNRNGVGPDVEQDA